jgi:hypothetical protein
MAASAGKYNILIQQGADYIETIVIKVKETGIPVDLTGCTIRGQVREDYSSTTALCTFVVENTDLANGKFTLTLSAATTAALSFERGVYDVEIQYPSGRVDRALQGSAVFSPEVTK